MSKMQVQGEIIELDEAIITLRTDQIIHINYKEGTVIDVKIQNKLFDIFLEICKEKKRPFLFSAMDQVSVTKEARLNAIKLEDRFPSSATAVIANTLAYKLIANFYLKVNHPQKPYRVFAKKEGAIEWLLSFVDQKGEK